MRPPDKHATALELVGVYPEGFGKISEIDAQEMMRDERLEAVEPEGGDLRQDLPLVRDAVREHDVECGEPVGCNDNVFHAKIVNIANFSPHDRDQLGCAGFSNNRIRHVHR